jgi:DNA-binding LytR/AlgR family response regulator
MRVENRFQTAYIDKSDVSCLEQVGRKVVVRTLFGEYWEYCSLEAMIERAGDGIYMCHQSLAINMDAITSVSSQGVELSDGSTQSMCHDALQRTEKAWKSHIIKK